MPILNKKKQKKAEEKRAAAPPPLPEQKPEQPEHTPEQSCDEDCHCQSRYVAPAESPERVAERLARYAADGRNAYGVLVNAPVQMAEQQPSKLHAGLWLQRDPHTAAECQTIVDLWGPELGADLILFDNCGWDLDDIYGVEIDQAWAEWCRARHAVASSVKAEEDARIAALWQKCVVEQAVVEARRNLKKGEQVQKNGRLCTRLYSCVGNKHTGGAKPTTMHVSSECFTHKEFLAGNIRDDCPFAHPGDSTWQIQWLTDRTWKPVVAAEPVRVFEGGSAAQRFAALAPKQAPRK